MHGRLGPSRGVGFAGLNGLLAVLGGVLVGVVAEIYGHAVAMAVHGLGDAGRDLVVDYADEGILEDELLRILADFQRIERIAGFLRPDEPGRSEAQGKGKADSERGLHGNQVYKRRTVSPVAAPRVSALR